MGRTELINSPLIRFDPFLIRYGEMNNNKTMTGFFHHRDRVFALVLIVRHAARASVIGSLLIGPALLLFGFGWEVFWLATVQGLVLAWRFRIDWQREYHELWLDRSNESGSPSDI